MTRTEHLLWILAEECAEVTQRASKAARFGLLEIQPEQSLTNEERLAGEVADIYGVVELLQENGHLGPISESAIRAKQMKVEKFLQYSVECGTLEESD